MSEAEMAANRLAEATAGKRAGDPVTEAEREAVRQWLRSLVPPKDAEK